MLRIDIDDTGHVKEIAASGSCEDVAAQLSGAICTIYHHLCESNEDAGELFREALQYMVEGDGVAWERELLGSSGQAECILFVVPGEEDT